MATPRRRRKGAQATDVTVASNVLRDVGTGIALNASACSGVAIVGNVVDSTIGDTMGDGIRIAGCGPVDSTISGNVLRAVKRDGVYLMHSSTALGIDGNVLTGAVDAGGAPDGNVGIDLMTTEGVDPLLYLVQGNLVRRFKGQDGLGVVSVNRTDPLGGPPGNEKYQHVVVRNNLIEGVDDTTRALTAMYGGTDYVASGLFDGNYVVGKTEGDQDADDLLVNGNVATGNHELTGSDATTTYTPGNTMTAKLELKDTPFAMLAQLNAADGTVVFCGDCAAHPQTGVCEQDANSTAIAKRLSGTWWCD